MDDQHSAAANQRQLRRAYYNEIVGAQQEQREIVPPSLKVDAHSKAQLIAARARRERRAAKRGGTTSKILPR
jgi:hypothetical protein